MAQAWKGMDKINVQQMLDMAFEIAGCGSKLHPELASRSH